MPTLRLVIKIHVMRGSRGGVRDPDVSRFSRLYIYEGDSICNDNDIVPKAHNAL